jgi:hypothetical protein
MAAPSRTNTDYFSKVGLWQAILMDMILNCRIQTNT